MTMGHGPSCWVNSWWVWLQKSRRTLPSCNLHGATVEVDRCVVFVWLIFALDQIQTLINKINKSQEKENDVSWCLTFHHKSIQFTVCDSFDCPCQLKTVGSPRWRSFQNEPFEKTPNNWARIRHLMPPTYPHSDLNHNHLFQLIHILLVSAS